MRMIHLAAAVLNQTPLDWAGNTQRLQAALADARAQGVSLLCLPEMCTCGYGCEDAFLSANTHARAWSVLNELLPVTRGLVTCLGLPILHQKGIFNAVALVVDGAVAGLVAKRFLAGDGIHYEPRWFKPWPAGVRDDWTAPDGRRFPIGDLLFEVGGVRIGFEICEDAWVANRPGAALARNGVDVILNPSASHFAFGKLEVRKRFVLEGSRAFGAAYLYANLLGNESGRAIYDGGALIAAGGQLRAVGTRFQLVDHALASATVDIEQLRLGQARTASFQPDLTAERPQPITIPFAWPSAPARTTSEGGVADVRLSKEEEFTGAETLALFDYLRKSGARGFVVSLSGGADSSAVTALIALMIRSALGQWGSAALASRLGFGPADDGDPRAWTRALLTTVYQASANSGSVTRAAARAVAEAVGADHLEWEIGDLVAGYVARVEAALGLKLSWQEHDVPLQNIQARVRSPGVWLVANIRQALLLCTSNRSEAAVGYATMDGDTSGGLAPLGGIDKVFLRHWLRWLETEGPSGLGPMPVLSVVNVQQPTAELRPAAAAQTDESDLMPYPVLDAIERSAIRDKRAPDDVLAEMRVAFPTADPVALGVWVDRFFRLWSRNQWKRERYAPSFHLDDENLDPKTWCRWPILSGGFAVELKELKERNR